MVIGAVEGGFFMLYTDAFFLFPMAAPALAKMFLKMMDSLLDMSRAVQLDEQLADALFRRLVPLPNQAGRTSCSIDPVGIATVGV